jgi:taurine dioxygenase
VASKNAPVVQPLVSIHPETGRASLLIGETAVKQIFGMTVEESAPILQYLTAHATEPRFVYRHRWQVGDMLVWDNRCAMHKVVADHSENAEAGAANQVRRMHRVTLRGQPSGRLLNPLSSAA